MFPSNSHSTQSMVFQVLLNAFGKLLKERFIILAQVQDHGLCEVACGDVRKQCSQHNK